MAPVEVWDPSTPPSTSSSSAATTCDSSESSETSESSDVNSAPVVSRTKCMNPGRRVVGRRIYDSILGVTCHWCRQKTVEDHVFCCHCNLAFCGGCLRNRHGEDIEIEMKEDVEWTCPKCRGGCGPGCKNCCNCGPCRKAQGLEPTGLFVHKARAHGFTNVHDYLIHQKTGESEEAIAKRKQGRAWCQTDPSSFRKKQKRIEDENVVEATCRKRLNFTSNDNDLQEKGRDKSLQSNASQIKEASPASSMSKGEELSQVGSLQNKVHNLKEPEHKVLRPPYNIVQPKREPDTHVHKEPCQKRAILSPGKDSNMLPHFQGNSVQPKFEPDLHVHEEPSNKATVSSSGKATDVHLYSQCEMQIKPSLPSQHRPSDQTDALPLLRVKDEQITYERDAQQLVIVKKEPSEPVSQPKHGASSYALRTLRRAKTDELLMCSKTSPSEQTIYDRHLRQVKKEFVEQPGQIAEGQNVKLMRVKEEFQDQCSQPICDNVSANKPNAFGAVFSRGKGDAACDFEVPSENVESSTSVSAFLNCETPRNTGDARPLASPYVSNFHLYPESFSPVFSHVEEGFVNGKCVFRSDVAGKGESMSSQEAQCNTAPCGLVMNKGSKDGSGDATQSPISFPPCKRATCIAVVKEEPEEVWNVHYPSPAAKSTMNASYTNSLLGSVKVHTERKHMSFTIEPSVCPCPSTSKTERLPLRKVKQEVIDCIDDDDEAIAVSKKDEIETPAGLKKSSSSGAVSHPWKVDDFKNKLEAKLSEPFSGKELEELVAAASHRKPIYKVRETRQGCFQFMSEEEGFSYLDHHPELDLQVKQAISPIAKLSLLRGLFFWLEHASTQGAFKPWTSVSRSPEVQENDDCVEIEGPDCEILAVVCSVDEEVNGQKSSRMRKKSTIVS